MKRKFKEFTFSNLYFLQWASWLQTWAESFRKFEIFGLGTFEIFFLRKFEIFGRKFSIFDRRKFLLKICSKWFPLVEDFCLPRVKDKYIDRVSYFSLIPKNTFWVLSCKIQTFSSIPDNLSLSVTAFSILKKKWLIIFSFYTSQINKITSRADDVIKRKISCSGLPSLKVYKVYRVSIH